MSAHKLSVFWTGPKHLTLTCVLHLFLLITYFLLNIFRTMFLALLASYINILKPCLCLNTIKCSFVDCWSTAKALPSCFNLFSSIPSGKSRHWERQVDKGLPLLTKMITNQSQWESQLLQWSVTQHVNQLQDRSHTQEKLTNGKGTRWYIFVDFLVFFALFGTFFCLPCLFPVGVLISWCVRLFIFCGREK